MSNSSFCLPLYTWTVCGSSFYRNRVRIVLALREMRNLPCWRNQFPLRSEWYSCIIFCIVYCSFWFSRHILVIPNEFKSHCLIVHIITFLPDQRSTPKRGNVIIKHRNSTLNFKIAHHFQYSKIQLVKMFPQTEICVCKLKHKTHLRENSQNDYLISLKRKLQRLEVKASCRLIYHLIGSCYIQ